MKSRELIKTYVNPLFTREYWQMLADHLGIGRRRKHDSIVDTATLATFISSRASHVAQVSLYGYLRTRAGTRFPTLFENPDLLRSINIAKWHIWLACVSDLGAYTGLCLAQSQRLDEARVRELVPAALARLLEDNGDPEEAGPDFAAAREKVLTRIRNFDWGREQDDDSIFSQSPEALFYWAPIAEELKERDEVIVKNSIRFRWIEVRRLTRRLIDPEALAQEPDTSAG